MINLIKMIKNIRIIRIFSKSSTPVRCFKKICVYLINLWFQKFPFSCLIK